MDALNRAYRFFRILVMRGALAPNPFPVAAPAVTGRMERWL
jgi:hypothetical protein